jgi:hypothetical protein
MIFSIRTGMLALVAGLGLLLLTLTTWAPRHASADTFDVAVNNLRILAAGGEGEPSAGFTAGAQSLVAAFDYADTDRTRVAVVVKSRGGVVCFRHEDRYSGEGSAQVTMTGDAMVSALVGAIDGAAREARRNADQAANPDRSAGTHEYLLSVQAGLLRVGFATTTLRRTELPDDIRGRIDDLVRLDGEATDLVERAVSLPTGDLDRKKSLAAQAAERLGSIVLIAGELTGAVSQLQQLPIPSTGSGEQDAYVVQLEVEGDVAASTELWVYEGGLIYMPYARPGR